mmetsp:Transcript_58449/g.107896  ORF Transcript_58449/g.107896 Transcript_58449/m.107896 type:complete len:159 (-) Transcript_58449:9-485(-)
MLFKEVTTVHSVASIILVLSYVPLRFCFERASEYEVQVFVGFAIIFYANISKRPSAASLLRSMLMLGKACIVVLGWQMDIRLGLWYTIACLCLWVAIVPASLEGELEATVVRKMMAEETERQQSSTGPGPAPPPQESFLRRKVGSVEGLAKRVVGKGS